MSAQQPAVADGLLDARFAAAMSKEAAAQMRRSLEVATNPDLMALYGFAVLDRDKMIAMIRSVVYEAGDEEAVQILSALAGIKGILERALGIAATVEARAIVTMHVALGQTLDDTSPEPDEHDVARQRWNEALAEHDRQHARFDALGEVFTDDAINKVAADFGPARDNLIGTPAPDLTALLRKFEVMWRPEDRMRGAPDEVDAGEFYKDLSRLAGVA